MTLDEIRAQLHEHARWSQEEVAQTYDHLAAMARGPVTRKPPSATSGGRRGSARCRCRTHLAEASHVCCEVDRERGIAARGGRWRAVKM